MSSQCVFGMNKSQYEIVLAKSKAVIKMVLESPDIHLSWKSLIKEYRFLNDVPVHKRQAYLRKHGSSALYPNHKSKLIHIGSFGSVWIDMVINGKKVRIAINPDAAKAEEVMAIMD